ncbi:MAG: hypothetical protein EKK53_12710 [Burkholderiales bacterium]|nr:MAG: hypothetical protein EKK53_12710 [Burkholderiales bacterium]
MPSPRSQPRPLPESLTLVAFPAAADHPAPVPLFIRANAAQIQLPPSPPPWLTLAAPAQLAPGLSRVDCTAADNPRQTLNATLLFRVSGQDWPVRVTQQPGLLGQFEQVHLLNTPLTVDMAVLVTYAAQLINDIEVPPIQLVVTIVAVLALIALGVIAALVRHLFVNVPEPKPLSTDTLGQPVVVVPGVAVSGLLPLTGFAVEDQTIALQTLKSIYWLLRQLK